MRIEYFPVSHYRPDGPVIILFGSTNHVWFKRRFLGFHITLWFIHIGEAPIEIVSLLEHV